MPPASPARTTGLALEEALSGWTVPLAALAVLAATAALHLLGALSEEATATVAVITIGLGMAVYLARAALDGRRDALTRGLGVAAAVLTAASVILPALATVHPGQPLFSGELAAVDDTLPVPPGLSGRVRVLISGALGQGQEPAIAYSISGTEDPIDGRLERTFSYARVGRSGRARVSHDRTADMVPARIPPGTQALKLDRLSGQTVSPLHLAVYREPLPFAGGPWILALVAVALAAAVDARLQRKNDLGVAAGMAVAFGLLVTYNATPAAALGPVMGGIILGAIVGSLGGWIVELLLRRFVPPAPGKAPKKTGVAAA